MSNEEKSTPEMLREKMRGIKYSIDKLQKEYNQHEAALKAFEGIEKLESFPSTFPKRIVKILKEVNEPMLSIDLRKRHNEFKDKEEMSPGKFASRMAATSKRGNYACVKKHHPKYGLRNFWCLLEWFDSTGQLKSEYEQIIDNKMKKITDGWENEPPF